jgi:hypothetical protein
MGDGERSDDFQHVNQCRSKPLYARPRAQLTMQHGGKQKSEQEENMIVTDQDMPDAFAHKTEELFPEIGDENFEMLSRLIRAENCRLGVASEFQFQQASVLGVEVEQRAIGHFQFLGWSRGCSGKAITA